MILLSFIMFLLNYVFSSVQQAHCILMSALASFTKETFEILLFVWGFFFFFMCTILWRCKLKPPQNGNLKMPDIDLSRNTIHMIYTTFIFLKVFWIRTNTVNVKGKNSSVLMWMNQRVLINTRVNYCAWTLAWKERIRDSWRAHVIRSKQGHTVRFVQTF